MKEVKRACLDCKDDSDVYLAPETKGIQSAFTRGPDNTTMIYTDDTCEICGEKGAVKRE